MSRDITTVAAGRTTADVPYRCAGSKPVRVSVPWGQMLTKVRRYGSRAPGGAWIRPATPCSIARAAAAAFEALTLTRGSGAWRRLQSQCQAGLRPRGWLRVVGRIAGDRGHGDRVDRSVRTAGVAGPRPRRVRALCRPAPIAGSAGLGLSDGLSPLV